MKTILNSSKKILGVLGAIILILIIVVPYVLLIYYLKKNNKTLQLFPEFKIKNIDNKEKVDQTILSQAINNGSEILQKIRGIK